MIYLLLGITDKLWKKKFNLIRFAIDSRCWYWWWERNSSFDQRSVNEWRILFIEPPERQQHCRKSMGKQLKKNFFYPRIVRSHDNENFVHWTFEIRMIMSFIDLLILCLFVCFPSKHPWLYHLFCFFLSKYKSKNQIRCFFVHYNYRLIMDMYCICFSFFFICLDSLSGNWWIIIKKMDENGWHCVTGMSLLMIDLSLGGMVDSWTFFCVTHSNYRWHFFRYFFSMMLLMTSK